MVGPKENECAELPLRHVRDIFPGRLEKGVTTRRFFEEYSDGVFVEAFKAGGKRRNRLSIVTIQYRVGAKFKQDFKFLLLKDGHGPMAVQAGCRVASVVPNFEARSTARASIFTQALHAWQC
ncbi:hypothetical protein D3C84_646600 [compost metagenome]